MTYTLSLHPNARDDLKSLQGQEPEAAARILALLQQAKVDQKLLDAFTIQDFGAHRTEAIHVQQITSQQRRGRDRNLWRIKIWSLEDERLNFRVVYALDPRVSRYTVLGVVPRAFNYDESHPLTQRIVAAYDSLGIPSYR